MATFARKVQTGETAAEILLDLMKTPQLSHLKFEFETGVDCIPFVTYTVSRAAVEIEEENP